jgi:hypothetical protein
MDAFKVWLATSVFGSAFKVFCGAMLGAILLTWSNEGQISFDHYQTWLIGALAIATPPLINWFNNKDTRYGRGKEVADAQQP